MILPQQHDRLRNRRRNKASGEKQSASRATGAAKWLLVVEIFISVSVAARVSVFLFQTLTCLLEFNAQTRCVQHLTLRISPNLISG